MTVLRLVLLYIILMFPDSSHQLSLSLSYIDSIAIIATYFINYIIFKGCMVYVFIHFDEPTQFIETPKTDIRLRSINI